MVLEITRHPFSIEDYEQMIAVGILNEDDRVELIEGEIVEMAALGDKHVICVNELTYSIIPMLSDDLRLSVQNTLRLGHSKPQPDLVVFRRSADRLPTIPTAANTLLIITVADSSLNYDRTKKLPLYAQAGIPETWLVDLVNRRIERHTEPSASGYRLIAIAGQGESLSSIILPGLLSAVDEVLGQ